MSENEAKYGQTSSPGVIKPTIGRQVWFWRYAARYGVDQPEAATVCYVWGDRRVNLQVIDRNGIARAVTSVNLRQPEDSLAEAAKSEFCEWMPFQKGQAQKLEQLQSALGSGQSGKSADER